MASSAPRIFTAAGFYTATGLVQVRVSDGTWLASRYHTSQYEELTTVGRKIK
jgi:hypothetical protein